MDRKVIEFILTRREMDRSLTLKVAKAMPAEKGEYRPYVTAFSFKKLLLHTAEWETVVAKRLIQGAWNFQENSDDGLSLSEVIAQVEKMFHVPNRCATRNFQLRFCFVYVNVAPTLNCHCEFVGNPVDVVDLSGDAEVFSLLGNVVADHIGRGRTTCQSQCGKSCDSGDCKLIHCVASL